MRTNIERAINGLILSNKDITLTNALPAYLQEAGFEKTSPDALTAFEHALDKYPTCHDESRAVFVKGISRIAREYWSSKPAMTPDIRRTCCDACAYRLFALRSEAKAKARGCEHSEEEEEKGENVLKRRLKSRKKGRRVRAKRDVVNLRFDPYAPSTSTARL